jgi:hypothetical protein
MIPERSGINIESTATGEGVAMAVDEAAMAHIMNVLTDLYADRELAVIREYATNALDSHVEAGNPDPIRVQLPGPLAPTFSVRDFGVGLDAEDIRTIYSRYGASTKRATNEAVGMLGLGCKSALAYCDQFTVTGYKGGVRTVVAVSRDEKGSGTMTILTSEPTSEPDGAEIAVPVNRDNAFGRKAADFFSYWPEGSVLVNGEPPQRVTGLALTDDLLVADYASAYARPNGKRHVVVMGNVAYPADLDVKLPHNKRLVARVPIGSVTFAPSREGLIDNAKTERTLVGIQDAFTAAARGAIQERVDAATSRAEALAALLDTCEALGLNTEGYVWGAKREPIPTMIRRANGEQWFSRGGRSSNAVGTARYYSRGGTAKPTQATIMEARKAVWVTGYPNGGFTLDQQMKLTRYLERDKDAPNHSPVLTITTSADALPAADWMEGVRTVTWEEVRKWKDPDRDSAVAEGSERLKRAGTYVTWEGGAGRSNYYPDHKRDANTIPTKHLYVMEGTQYEGRDTYNRLVAIQEDATLCVVPSTRMAKFKRTFPEAKDAEAFLTANAEKWWRRLSEDAKVGLASPALDAGLAKLPADEVADERLARCLRVQIAADPHRQTAKRLAGYLNGAVAKVKDRAPVTEVEGAYPLIVRAGSANISTAHLVTYVNAIHAAKAAD